MSVEVTDAPARSRFEARIDGELVGYAEYRRQEGCILFSHTDFEATDRGGEAASAMAAYSLDTARSNGWRVEPVSGYYAGWIERHPEYADLVPPDFPSLGEET